MRATLIIVAAFLAGCSGDTEGLIPGAASADAGAFDDASTSEPDAGDDSIICGLANVDDAIVDEGYPALIELRLENAAPRVGESARFIGRVSDDASGIEQVELQLWRVDPAGLVSWRLTRDIGANGSFSIELPVDRCTVEHVMHLSSIRIRDRAGHVTTLEFSGPGQFRVRHDERVVGMIELATFELTPFVADPVPLTLTSIGASQTREGPELIASIDGAGECTSPQLLIGFGAVDELECRSITSAVTIPAAELTRITLSAFTDCLGRGRWRITELSLLGPTRWTEPKFADPTGLVPLDVDFGGAMPSMAAPRLSDFKFSTESTSRGTMINLSARAESECLLHGLAQLEHATGARFAGNFASNGDRIEACIGIPSNAVRGEYELQNLFATPRTLAGCVTNIRVRGDRYEESSDSESELPTEIIRVEHR